MTTEFFVARDRARRLGYRLEKVLQERRLAWRGAEIGMSTVSDDADQALADIARDARRSVEQVLAGEIRDRERGFMEIPFAVALTAVAQRVEDAAALEVGRRLRQVPEARGRKGVVDALAAALARLEAFQAAYDAKTPLPEAGTLDLAHLLTHLAPPGQRPYDRPPPPFVTDAHGLADLLLAARAALGDAGSPWQVTPPDADRPLTLALGSTEGEAAPVPPAVDRAARVLAFRHPVEVEAFATEDGGERPRGLRLLLGDAEGSNLEATVAAVTGGEAHLTPEAKAAIRALLDAPPAEEGVGPAPQRLVALHGVLQVLDASLRAQLGPRLLTPTVRMGALELPREHTRKARVRPAVLAELEREFEGLAAERLQTLSLELGKSRWSAGGLGAMDAAVLLAAFGRDVARKAHRLERHLRLLPLTDEDVAALVRSLIDVALVRRELEAGRDVDSGALTRLECGAIAALARLGRLAETGEAGVSSGGRPRP
jgi:hypothetical protein